MLDHSQKRDDVEEIVFVGDLVHRIDAANRDALLQPLIDRVMGIAIQSQPDYVVVRDELGFNTFDPVTLRPDNLIDRMITPNPDPLEPQADTRGIAKGACGAVLGSAIALVQ